MNLNKGIRIGIVGLTVALGAIPAEAAQQPPPFPRDGATSAGENDFFAIWDTTLQTGKATPMHQLQLDQVYVFMSDGALKFTRGDGTSTIENVKLGGVRYVTKGTVESETVMGEAPVRMMVFQLKDAVPQKRPRIEGVPDKFGAGRLGVTKLFETDRIAVYDYVWLTGMVTPPHMHYHTDAGVYIVGGKTMVAGSPPNEWKRGQITMGTTPMKAPHSEAQLEGEPHGISIQLKDR